MNNRNRRYNALCFQLLCVFFSLSILHIMIMVFVSSVAIKTLILLMSITCAIGAYLMIHNIIKDW